MKVVDGLFDMHVHMNHVMKHLLKQWSTTKLLWEQLPMMIERLFHLAYGSRITGITKKEMQTIDQISPIQFCQLLNSFFDTGQSQSHSCHACRWTEDWFLEWCWASHCRVSCRKLQMTSSQFGSLRKPKLDAFRSQSTNSQQRTGMFRRSFWFEHSSWGSLSVHSCFGLRYIKPVISMHWTSDKNDKRKGQNNVHFWIGKETRNNGQTLI